MSTGCGGSLSLAALKVAGGVARVNILSFYVLPGAKPEPFRNTVLRARTIHLE
jgi:hypothetical protein